MSPSNPTAPAPVAESTASRPASPMTEPAAEITSDQPEITVGVITYNGKNIIGSCLDSLRAQTYPNLRIFVVDNASTDGTPAWLAQNYPDIEVRPYPENNGPNPARNFAITQSPNDLVLLVDDDAILSENCLAELFSASQAYPDGAIWSPRIVYSDRRDTIQFEGARMHYLAETILVSGDTLIPDGVPDVTQVQMIAGVTLLVSKTAALDIGLFDEYYFFGRTDGEFTYRLTQAGQKIYTVPQAICYHRVKKRGLSKVFYQVRNRWLMLLTTFSLRTILLALPALILYEFSLMGFLLMKGRFFDYLKALLDVIVHFSKVIERRRDIQQRRQIPDRDLIDCTTFNMRKDLMGNNAIALLKTSLDRFFSLYWKLIYRFI